MTNNNRFVIKNDSDLREGIKKWFCNFIFQPSNVVFFDFQSEKEDSIDRFSANGFNNLLIIICALQEKIPNIQIYVQLISDEILEKIDDASEKKLRNSIKKLLIFYESLNLIDMLLKLGVVLRPSDEVIKILQENLDAKKIERTQKYSSKILCLSPLINNSQEQYNLTYRMRTLFNILYWQLKERIDFKEVKEASGQIMFELVKNIYQHSRMDDGSAISGFTCAQINNSPIIVLDEEMAEKNIQGHCF